MSESAAVTYGTYLALDDVLGAQHPRSEEHDELLFIVIHQVYELWFKQILHEIARLQRCLEAGDGSHALHTLRRVLTILKTIVTQIDVLETMTPRQFSSFRSRLATSSGFQSAQFRELEAVLGRRSPSMLRPYAEGSTEHAKISAALARRSLPDSLVRYLGGPAHLLERDVTLPWAPDRVLQDRLVDAYVADGQAAQVLERLVDLDEGLQEWRYRHVKMVERTIGDQPGTGGSPGAAYLRSTLFTPLFEDLWAIRSRL